MNKQALLSVIISGLDQLGIQYSAGLGADITIACEFLDAEWSTGNKKITYQASIFADESSGIVYMWEYTKEKASGISFGGDSEISFQTGATLFRKVKSAQFGPDGKAYEITLDLGAIPKTIKDAAEGQGWNFKTVLKKEKAAYPPGYAPSSSPQAPPRTDTSDQARNAGFCSGCGKGLAKGESFCPGCGKPVSTAAPSPQQNNKQAPSSPNPEFFRTGAKPLKTKKSSGKPVAITLSIVAVAVIVVLVVYFTNNTPGNRVQAAAASPAVTAAQTAEAASPAVITTQTAEAAQPAGGAQAESSAAAFYVSSLDKCFGVWDLLSDDYATQYLCMYGHVMINIDAADINDKVSALQVSNFTVTKPPAAGTPEFMASGETNITMASERGSSVLKDTFDVPIVDKTPDNWASWMSYYANQDGYGQFVIRYGIFDLGEITGSTDPISDGYTYISNTYSDDSLRSTIAFDVTLTTQSGKVYTRHIEMEMIEGEFIKPMMEVTEVRNDYSETPAEMALTEAQ